MSGRYGFWYEVSSVVLFYTRYAVRDRASTHPFVGAREP